MKFKGEWVTDRQWACFIGENRSKLKLTTKPEPYTFQRTISWLARQVAPTLKMAIKLDKVKGTNIISSMIDNAKLTERHRKLLEQQLVDIEKLTVSEDIEKINKIEGNDR